MALCANSALATPGYVQGNYAVPQTPQTVVTVPYTATQAATDLNVVIVGWNDTRAQISSVTDTAGNIYQLAVGPTQVGSTLSQSIYYAKNILAPAAGANAVTVTFSQAAIYPDIRILEYSGIDTLNPVDVLVGATGNNSSTNSGTVTTTNATDLLVGANCVKTSTSGPGSGFAARMISEPDGDIAEDAVVTATGSYSATAPLANPGPWVMQLVAFRAAGSSTPGPTPTPTPSLAPSRGLGYVQGNYAVPQTPQTTVTVPYTTTQTATDLNVVVVGWNDTTAQINSVTDTAKNIYQLAVGPTQVSGTLSQSIFYAKNIVGAAPGANAVTVTFSQAAIYPDIRILEYSGIDTLNPVDAFVGATGNNSSTNSGAVTTTNATDLLVGANSVKTWTNGAGSGFTSRMITEPDGDIAEDTVVTTTGSYNATAPLGNPGPWVMQLVAFRAANSATSTPTPTPTPTPTQTPAPVPTASPTLVQHVATGMDNWPCTTLTITLPNAVGAGNALILGVQYQSAGSISSITDNGGDAWIAGPTTTNSAKSQRMDLYYCLNAVPGTQKVVVTLNGLQTIKAFPQAVLSEFYNVAPANALDGRSSNSTSLSPGPITTTSPGDLIYEWAVDFSDIGVAGYGGGGFNGSSITGGSNFTLLSADLQVGSADQYYVQPSAGPISPSLTASGSSQWGSVALALKAAPGGTAPAQGIRIVHVQHSLLTLGGYPIALQFPSSGNLLVLSYTSPDVWVSSITDNASNTWVSAGLSQAGVAQILYAANASTGPTLGAIQATLTGINQYGAIAVVLYDIAGAAGSPFDNATTASGNQVNGGNLTTTTLTPAQPNELLINTTSIAFHTINGVVGTGFVLDSAVNAFDNDHPSTGGTDTSTLDEDDGFAHITSTLTDPVVFTYTATQPSAGGVESWGAVAAAFKPEQATATPTPTQP